MLESLIFHLSLPTLRNTCLVVLGFDSCLSISPSEADR